MGADSRLRVRISIIVALGALVVAVGVAQLLSNTTHLRSSANSAVSSDRYLLRVVEVERLVVDVETGLRGYLVTGRPVFLAPLRVAEGQLPAAYAALRQSAAQEHAFGPQAAALITASRQYVSGYVADQLARAAHDLAAARSLALTQQGKAQVDAVRSLSATLQRAVADRQAARQSAARRSADQSIVEAIILLVLLTAFTLLLGGILGRLAVQRERARELAEHTVATLQRSILPSRIPAITDCELAIRFLPAGGGLVSGDFYDVYEVGPGCWAIVIGDVCGKGAGAAAVSAMARWTLRSLAGPGVSPADALHALNAAIVGQDLDARFITLSYMTLSVAEDRATVSVASAGHPAPIYVPLAGEPAALEVGGDILGVWPEIRLQAVTVTLAPGDALLAFTDGVTDQGSTVTAGPESALRRVPVNADAEQLADRLVDFAQETPGPQRDDIAILALRFVGSSRSASARTGSTFSSSATGLDAPAPVAV
jgi:serine phosphatase RsbU (regulator of sigma subunit)